MDFANFDFDDIQTAITALKDAGATSSLAYRDGDHWQANSAWIGPRPKTGGDSSNVLKEIERGLVSQNVVKEVIERHSAAVIGREPSWSVTVRRALKKIKEKNAQGIEREVNEPVTQSEQALIDEAEAVMTDFWDVRELLNLLHDAVENLLASGRATIRIFIPRALLDDLGMVPVGDLSQSFEKMYVNVPEFEQATVLLDPDTQKRAGIYAVDEKQGNETVRYAVITFTDDDRKTIIRVMEEEKEPQETDPLELDGRLTIFEMTCEPLISPQVRQHQAMLNMARTMMARNVVLAGFLERTLIDVEMPGEWIGEGNNREWVPNPMYVGAGATNILASAVLRDEKGNPILDDNNRPTLGRGSIVYRDPVPVTTFEETADAAYRAILKETHQVHALISGDATASGESRKQAMDDFRKSLQPTKAQIDACGRWLLETSLAMAAHFSGQPGRFKELRAVFDSQVDVGKPGSDEVNVGRGLVKEKVWSRPRLQTLTGVEDTEAEDAIILADEEKLNPLATVGKRLDNAGKADGVVDELEKLKLAGYSEVDAKAILARRAKVDVIVDNEQ